MRGGATDRTPDGVQREPLVAGSAPAESAGAAPGDGELGARSASESWGADATTGTHSQKPAKRSSLWQSVLAARGATPYPAGMSLSIRDDRGKTLHLAGPPQRIVSLVPSETYSVVRLGAGARLVGRTDWCVEPADAVGSIATVGGTKDPDIDRIAELAPDLVLANQEENTKQAVLALEERGLCVLVSFPRTVAQGLAHLARLARALGVEDGARPMLATAYRDHAAASAHAKTRRPVRTFVPIWMDPLMTVHGDTFISDVLAVVGAENVFAGRPRRYPLAADLGKTVPLPASEVGERDVRYPRVSIDEVVAASPELVLLPDEPHAFTEADAAVFRNLAIPAARTGHIVHCDGRDLMWPGARAMEGLARLTALVDSARSDVRA